MGRDDQTAEERAVLARRLASAVDFLISVANSSGLPAIAARLKDVHQDLEQLLRVPEGNGKSVGKPRGKTVDDDRF